MGKLDYRTFSEHNQAKSRRRRSGRLEERTQDSAAPKGSGMATTFESRTLGIGIDRPFDAVHDFLSAPENFPKWAAGLGQSIRKADDDRSEEHTSELQSLIRI